MKKLNWTNVITLMLVFAIAWTTVAGPFASVALAGPRDGRLGVPHSPRAIGPLGTVADTLDLSVPQMLLMLHFRYDSIADLAEARGTDSDAVVQALVDEVAGHLGNADNLTQAQVDWILAQVERKATGFVYVEFPFGAAIDVLQPAADSIGVSVDALVDELQDDQSIADVAEANGVGPAAVEQAIVDYRAGIWNEAVAVGLLTETQVDILVDLYTSKVTDIVSGDFSPGSGGVPGVPQSPHGMGPLSTVADELNLTVPQMLTALFTHYDSIADLARVRRTEPDTIVQALVDEVAGHLGNADNLTQAQVDWILAQVERKATGFVYVEFPYGAAIDVLQPAADSIGVSVDALVDELQAGQTIADVALANGVDPATVEQALVDYRAGIWDGAVDVGLLTETQENILLDLYSSKVSDIVTARWPNGTLLELIIDRFAS